MAFLKADEISRIYSDRLFDMTGATPRRRKILCPLPMHNHSNYTPSFSIYWSRNRWCWRCFGNCNLRGDVIDFVGYMHIPGYDPRDPQKLSKAISMLTGENYTPSPPTPPERTHETRLPAGVLDRYRPISPEVISYGRARGVNEGTLRSFYVGAHYDHRHTYMTIPTIEEGQVTGIKLRNIDPGGARYRSVKGSRAGLFNYDSVLYQSGHIFVVKGEIAALVMIERGLLACAPSGGESMKLDQRYVNALALAHVIVIGDNDRDQEVREKTRKMAEERSKSLGAKLVFPPEKYKDVDEWILDNPEAINKLKEM